MLNLVANGPSGYNLTRSLRFRASASAYLSRTPASASNRKTWTYSIWLKRGALNTFQCLLGAGTSGAARTVIALNSGAASTYDNIILFHYNGATGYGAYTTPVYRDPSAWYHIVVAVDTTQATSTNRIKIYVNGNQQSATGYDGGYPAQNTDFFINNNTLHTISKGSDGSNDFIDGYQAETYFIDGQQLTPSSFGSTNATTGVWQPAKYTGTYGTNGFYLPFTDNSALTTSSNVGLGKDFSGNSNYWVTNNISITAGTTYDSMTDVPTLTSATAANYSTWNPLQKYSGLSAPTNGNLTIAGNSANWRSILSTFAVSSGKWYCEIVMTSVSADALTGIFNINNASDLYDLTTVDNRQLARYAGGYGYQNNGNKVNNNTGTSYGSTYTTSDIIGIAFDLDNGKIWFSKNGTWQASGDPAAGTNAAYTGLSGLFAVGMSTANGTFDANFGQRGFTYTPPTGYVALNTYNLPTSTIVKGNTVMDATLWTGTGSTLSLTNTAGFKPDLVWVKDRSSTPWHSVSDSVRGAAKTVWTNATDQEYTNNATGYISAFNSNGFSVAAGSLDIKDVNRSGDSYVGWQWQAGQGTTSSNTNGTITSTVSVNATAGFSVVTYTGTSANATVGHGLGIAPKMIIFKGRSTTFDWMVYHTSLGNTNYLRFNTTAASAASVSAFNNTSPTSTTFSLGDGSLGNQGSATQVAYCWAEIAGFSKFGSYTGNGSADGPFVFTNFLPKFVLVKRTDTINDWAIIDTSRSAYNVSSAVLFPNLSDAETASGNLTMDILSNGFKLRATSVNANGGTYIYMAFASSPFKNSLAR